jgi:lysophospholipase L1-like esterase
MHTVILIGDSIRMGYCPFVVKELEGLAEVWSPEPNGGTSENVLRHLDEWVLSHDADAVHVNAGLHDLRKAFGATESAIPLASYQANVEAILKTIRAKTRARLIWAATTPVNEARHHATKGFDRFEADVVAYNEAAATVANRLGVEINDLYRVVMDAGRDRLLGPDGVHFTPEGSALLGKAVADFIRGKGVRK